MSSNEVHLGVQDGVKSSLNLIPPTKSSRKTSLEDDYETFLRNEKARILAEQETAALLAKEFPAPFKNANGLDFVIPPNMPADDEDPCLSIIYQPGGSGVRLTRQVFQLIEIRISSKYLTLRNRELFSRQIWGGELPKEIRSRFPYVTPPAACRSRGFSPDQHTGVDLTTNGLNTSTPNTTFSSAPDYCLSPHLYTDDSDAVAILHHTNHFQLRMTPPPFLGVSAIFRVLPCCPFFLATASGSYHSRASPSTSTTGSSATSSSCTSGSSHKYSLQLVRTECIEKGSLIQPYTRKKPLQPGRRFRDIRLASMQFVNERPPVNIKYISKRLRRRMISDANIAFSMEGDPVLRYSLGMMTEHGISPRDWTSSLLTTSQMVFELIPSRRLTTSAGLYSPDKVAFPLSPVIEQKVLSNPQNLYPISKDQDQSITRNHEFEVPVMKFVLEKYLTQDSTGTNMWMLRWCVLKRRNESSTEASSFPSADSCRGPVVPLLLTHKSLEILQQELKKQHQKENENENGNGKENEGDNKQNDNEQNDKSEPTIKIKETCGITDTTNNVYATYLNALATLHTGHISDDTLDALDLDIDSDEQHNNTQPPSKYRKSLTQKSCTMITQNCSLASNNMNTVSAVPDASSSVVAGQYDQWTKEVLETNLLWGDLLWGEASVVIRGVAYGNLINVRFLPYSDVKE